MKEILLTEQERATQGFTHKFIIPVTDLNTTAGLTKVIDLKSVAAGATVKNAAMKVVTNLDGGATTAVGLELGYDLASGSDDPNGFIETISVHADGTPIAFGMGNGVAFATKLTGYVFLEAAVIEALFTSTTHNLDLLTTGEVHIYLELGDLTKI